MAITGSPGLIKESPNGRHIPHWQLLLLTLWRCCGVGKALGNDAPFRGAVQHFLEDAVDVQDGGIAQPLFQHPRIYGLDLAGR